MEKEIQHLIEKMKVKMADIENTESDAYANYSTGHNERGENNGR